MLSNPSQYSPLGLIPQFPGLQAAGLPQMTPGLFGQPAQYNGNAHLGNAQLGAESGQAGFGQPFPLGGQANPFLQNSFQQNASAQNPFTAGAFAPNPYFQSQGQSAGAHNPFLSSFAGQAGAHNPLQQIVPVLVQLAQQIALQSAVVQQIGIAVHQLAHQLASQGLQGQGYGQSGYGGPGPQAQGWGQAWGANRQQTIQ
jgi:hypothetical protein